MRVFQTDNSKDKAFLSTVQSLFLMIYFIELVFPRFNIYGNSTLICLCCFYLWLVTAYIISPSLFYEISLVDFALIALYILMVFIPYAFGYSVISHRYMSTGLFFWGHFIFKYYKSTNQLKKLGIIIVVVAILSCITACTTLSALLKDPYIARSIKSSGEYSASLAKKNIGGYKIIYYFVGCDIIFLYLFAVSKGILKKISFLLLYLFILFTIIKSNYMTAFLTVIICSVLLVVFIAIAQRENIFFTCLFCFFVILLLISLLDKLALMLPERISRVLLSGNKGVFEAIVDEFKDDRFPTLIISWEAASSNPVSGLIGSNGLSYSGQSLQGFGQHSFFLDTLALYGMPIGIFFIAVVLKASVYSKKTGKHKVLNQVILVYTVMTLLFNNATDSIALIIYIFCPFIQYITQREQGECYACDNRKVVTVN